MNMDNVKEILHLSELFHTPDRNEAMKKARKLAADSGETEEVIVVLISGISKRINDSKISLDIYKEKADKTIDNLTANEMQLAIVKKELESLQSDAEKAYLNYKKLTDQLQESKEKALLNIEKINTQLSAAGISGTTESKSILGTFIAIIFSVSLAFLIIYLSYKIGGSKPTSNIEISYDLGKMIEAFLLGSGALIAGVAYAFSILKHKSKSSE